MYNWTFADTNTHSDLTITVRANDEELAYKMAERIATAKGRKWKGYLIRIREVK